MYCMHFLLRGVHDVIALSRASRLGTVAICDCSTHSLLCLVAVIFVVGFFFACLSLVFYCFHPDMPRITRNSRDCGFSASVTDVPSVSSIAELNLETSTATSMPMATITTVSSSASASVSDGQSTTNIVDDVARP